MLQIGQRIFGVRWIKVMSVIMIGVVVIVIVAVFKEGTAGLLCGAPGLLGARAARPRGRVKRFGSADPRLNACEREGDDPILDLVGMMNRRLSFHLSIQTHLSTLSILRKLDGLLVAILNDAIHPPSSFDGNYRKCARLVGNQESCHIPSIHRAALAIPDARGSLRGYGRNSLTDVHLEVGLGASDFGV
jgi:hypothetical protein